MDKPWPPWYNTKALRNLYRLICPVRSPFIISRFKVVIFFPSFCREVEAVIMILLKTEQVTFLKYMALIIRRFKLFWLHLFQSGKCIYIHVLASAFLLASAWCHEHSYRDPTRVSPRNRNCAQGFKSFYFKHWREHRDINALFCLKTLANQKSVRIDEWNSHYFSFIKVTCPFHVFLFFTYRNTIGNIPVNWYDDYPHIGYDLDGKQIRKPKVKHLNLEWSVEVSSCA